MQKRAGAEPKPEQPGDRRPATPTSSRRPLTAADLRLPPTSDCRPSTARKERRGRHASKHAAASAAASAGQGEPSTLPSSQAPCLPSSQPPKLPASQAPCLPSSQPPKLPASHAPSLPSSQPPVLPTSDPGALPAMQRIGRRSRAHDEQRGRRQEVRWLLQQVKSCGCKSQGDRTLATMLENSPPVRRPCPPRGRRQRLLVAERQRADSTAWLVDGGSTVDCRWRAS